MFLITRIGIASYKHRRDTCLQTISALWQGLSMPVNAQLQSLTFMPLLLLLPMQAYGQLDILISNAAVSGW